jgi:hypothetical protein
MVALRHLDTVLVPLGAVLIAGLMTRARALKRSATAT